MRKSALAILIGVTLMGCAHNAPHRDGVFKDPDDQVFGESENAAAAEDPYLWLEDVAGEKSLDWARARNAESSKEIESDPGFAALETELKKILDSKDKIPYVEKDGAFYYNFWKDLEHPRGLWRRTSFAEYVKPNPKWDVVIDVDALATAENENWVWHGADCLRPAYKRCLVSLSRGGADANVVREFDLEKRAWVKDGFALPEAKSFLSWIDVDHLFVGTDFGAGSMTSSGYPRVAKRWTRGTPLSDAVTIYEGQESDVAAVAIHDHTKDYERDFIDRTPTFFTDQQFLLGKDGKITRIETPDDAKTGVVRDWLTVELRTPWTTGGKTYPAGALLAARFDAFMAGKREFDVLFEPTPTTSLESYVWTKSHVILNVLDDVKNRLTVLTPGKGGWKREPFAGAPAIGTVSASAVDTETSDEFFMTVTDFLTPTTLYHGTIGANPRALKTTPAFFDATNLEISQHFTTSKDGTRVPYFQVSRKGLALDGSNPTLLSGYGGFEVSEVPYYSGNIGAAWLAKGGVYVLANIRGGGEYGPKWHEAALKANRPRAYEDFAAIARDLVARKVTSVKHLGIQGGSNGGLLMGNMFVMYPELFGAVVCQVPLLDMKRYSHLLAGASWMAEYGDPDKPEEWAFVKTFSPYQNVRADVKYPPILFMTSTRDDRVHPGHARKMMARMKDMGHDVRYYENIEGGHGGAADNKQAAHMWAMAFTFLWQQLK